MKKESYRETAYFLTQRGESQKARQAAVERFNAAVEARSKVPAHADDDLTSIIGMSLTFAVIILIISILTQI